MAQDVNQSEMEVAAQVRTALVARISQERYELWIPADCQWKLESGGLAILFPNEFRRQIAQQLLADDLRQAVTEVLGSRASFRLDVIEHPEAPDGEDAMPVRPRPVMSNDEKPSPTLLLHESQRSEEVQRDDGRAGEFAGQRRSHSWSEFLAGPSNQLAVTAINMIVSDPGKITPLLLHGPCGVGKTHLVGALAQRLRMQKRQRRVLHITSEQFTNDFTEAFRGTGLPMLRRKYRDLDTLILEDVQFLIGKKATISELRHTVDNLLKGGRQVVLTSDRSLNELEPLGSDFVARMRGGLVSPLMPLDEETRFQLLKADLHSNEVAISDDIVLQIAARAVGDGRLLKGISKRLMARAYMSDGHLTWDECWNGILDLIQATQPIVRLSDIERVVCEVFNLEPNILQSDCKTRAVSQPRMLAMFLARKYTPAAYQEIGEFFGKRRHSTVISAEKTVGSWLDEDAKLQVSRGWLSARDAIRNVESHLNVG